MRKFVWLVMFMFLLVGTAKAALIMTIEDLDTNDKVTISDNDNYDRDNMLGLIDYSGSIGEWWINIQIGQSYPVLGTVDKPELHLASIDANNTVGTNQGSTLKVTIYDDFGPLNTTITGWEAGLGGSSNTDGSVEMAVYIDNTRQILLSESLGSSFSTNSIFNADPALYNSTFSMGLEILLSHNGTGTTSIDASINPVPEPATLLMVGAGLMGIGFLGRRRIKKK